MEKIFQGIYEGERALYAARELSIDSAVFRNGESPLKESRDIELTNCIFEWKYPLWYCKNIRVTDSTLLTTARSGIWYTDGISLSNCTIDAPKTFRRASGIYLEGCTMPFAQETLWSCRDITLRNVSAAGDYFAMNSRDIDIDGLSLSGNYAFDGCENVVIKNSRLISKDALWNCKNVTVENSVIIGEYIGWNSENVTLVNCTVESNQGFCYMKNVRLVGCKLMATDLAFELSTVEAEVLTDIESVKNPISGSIRARAIGELILDESVIDPRKTEITTDASEVSVI